MAVKARTIAPDPNAVTAILRVFIVLPRNESALDLSGILPQIKFASSLRGALEDSCLNWGEYEKKLISPREDRQRTVASRITGGSHHGSKASKYMEYW